MVTQQESRDKAARPELGGRELGKVSATSKKRKALRNKNEQSMKLGRGSRQEMKVPRTCKREEYNVLMVRGFSLAKLR